MTEVDGLTGQWDYSTLPKNVVLGKDCFIERKHSFERFRSQKNPGLVLGDRVVVYTWTTFNVEPGGLIVVGDESILVGAVFMCAERIQIGNRVVVSYNVTIADSDFHPKDPLLRKADAIANAPYGDRSRRPSIVSKPVIVGDGAWIGIGAIILKGVTIGARARICAGSVVTTDVPAGVAVAGNPARMIPEEAL